MKCVIPCINIPHCSLYNCGVSSTGAIALGKGLQENNSLEKLEYVTNTLIETLTLSYLKQFLCITGFSKSLCTEALLFQMALDAELLASKSGQHSAS